MVKIMEASSLTADLSRVAAPADLNLGRSRSGSSSTASQSTVRKMTLVEIPACRTLYPDRA